MMNELSIDIRNASFTYPGAESPSLDNVSLSIPKGECVVITGPSGCGKTTLTCLINGLIPHVYEGELTGTVLISGRDSSTWDAGELGTTVGSVFQNPRSQFVNIDVTSEIAFGCENLGLPREEIVKRVRNCAQILGIEHLLGRHVENLSGGQKQLVIIASALAMGPDILVLDEPTASLDVDAMRALARAVKILKAQGKTVVVSEHRLWWLKSMADRVIRMRAGKIVGDWPVGEYQNIPWRERLEAGERAWSIDEIDINNELDESPLMVNQRSESTHELLVENLKVSYKRADPILDDVNLQLDSGSVVGLLGRNGAGKTTLLRTLSGLMREQAGKVVLDETTLPFRKRLGDIHLVMQEPGYQLFADSVFAEAEQAAGDAQIAEELLDKFELISLKNRHPLSLSGGERQRLSIAAGILQGSQAIVLDEPTSGLDRQNMVKIAQEIRDFAQKGHVVCIVTHDFEFLCSACDLIAELDSGKISRCYRLDEVGLERARKLFGFQEELNGSELEDRSKQAKEER